MNTAGHTPSARRAAGSIAAQSLPLLLVAAAAVLLRPFSGTNVDVSWLITVGEKMLAGERLYVDLIEVNPPASAFLYLPAVMLARSLGLSPEVVVDVLVFFAAGASLWLAGRILRRTPVLDGVDVWSLAAWSGAVLLILPMHTFGEREHFAVIALLPALAVMWARAGRKDVALWSIAVAGVGSAVAIIIKPYFALPVALAAGASAYAGSWRALFAPENWIALALAAAYAMFVVVAYPEFIGDVMPLVQAVYLPARQGWLPLLTTPGFLCWVAALVLLAGWKRRAMLAPPLSLLLAASAGFAVIYLVQGKGWPYHSYPMLALAFLALTVAGLERKQQGRGPADFLPAVVLAAVSCVWLNVVGRTDALTEPLRRLAPHPSMLVIGSDPAIGHPLVRRLEGRWVSRVGGLWISAGVFQRLVEETLDPATKARLLQYAARDRDMLAADILRNRPELIVIEKDVFDWERWARADPLIGERLRAYRQAAVFGTLVVLKRDEAGRPAN